MNARELMVKAERAMESARLLLDAGDADGACNRAYYAMFDAARAALLASKAPVATEVARTHGGLISAFSLHLVKTGLIPVGLGRTLNRAEEIRLIADYRGDPIERDMAVWVVEQAEAFVQEIRTKFIDNSDPN
ncbi:MAG: HEPN domain-containing protein [Candidatus Methylumidiphilus sp.]